MSKEFMKVYHMPFKAQEIKDDNFTNFRLQFDQAFEEMTKSFTEQQDEIIVNYLYEKYKDTKVSDVWVLSKPDFEKFLLEMLPKWKGKDLKGANYDNIIIDEAQEPKHYLKWEDLEFEHTPKIIDVKMGDNKYKLFVGYNVAGNHLVILRNGKQQNSLVCLSNEKQQYYFLEADKQFFNDLRLEMVEE